GLKRWFVRPDVFCPHSTAISRGFSKILNDLNLTKIVSNRGGALKTGSKFGFRSPLLPACGANRPFTIR
ncbi:MAG: hypothetical protein ACJ8FA_11855, partial [Xanthobacteraceae bacterium]